MYVGVCLLIVHLCEAGKELLKVLRRGRIAVSGLGFVNEGHLDRWYVAFFCVIL